jgi:hypothetical protein
VEGPLGDEESINAIDVRGGKAGYVNAEANCTMERYNGTSALRTHPANNCAIHRIIVA